MENIQFEITHERLIALIAKYIDVPPEQIALQATTAEEIVGIQGSNLAEVERTSEITVVVRTDLPTAIKIDRKLKRLDGGESACEQAATE